MIVAVADTHALVWALMGDARLSPAARAVLTVSATDQIAISAISLVELAYLEEKRRLPTGLLAFPTCPTESSQRPRSILACP